MTAIEFEEFLESIGGLKNGHYPNKPNITQAGFFEIGPGWYPLVKSLIEWLIIEGWNKEICQVKEKFGGLRFYINEGSDKIHNIIETYEKQSLITCEECGNPGSLHGKNWLRTLCNKHKESQQ